MKRMSAFDFTFEELAIEADDDATDLVDGGCDVSFSGLGDFEVTDIYIVIDNGLWGQLARTKRHYLKSDDDSTLWCRVHDAIIERYRDRIEERIACEMAEARDAR
jgi:hypothetical protein